MRFFRQIEWTIRICGIVLVHAARGISLRSLTPALVTLTAYPLLLMAGLAVPLAFVIAHSLGYASLVWLAIDGAVERLHALKMPGWTVLALHLFLIAIVLWLESPAAALRVMYIYLFFRILMFLLDISDGKATGVQLLWPHPDWRNHDAALTRVLLLRDIAMILLSETVIFTGSVPLMLALLALWQVLHCFIDSVVATSVYLVRQTTPDR